MNIERRNAIIEVIERELASLPSGAAGDAVSEADERIVEELGRVLRETCAWDDHDVEQIVKSCLPVRELRPDELRQSVEKIFAGRAIGL